MVVDLDETLVHSSFKPIDCPEMILSIPGEESKVKNVYIRVRPGAIRFLHKMGQIFELVIFTASMSDYAKALVAKLDKYKTGFQYLSREHWKLHRNRHFIKDLDKLGRDLKDVIIVDNTPMAYMLHPQNAIAIKSWYKDVNDTELLRLMPVLTDLARVEDVREHIKTLKVVPQSSIGSWKSSRLFFSNCTLFLFLTFIVTYFYLGFI